MKVDGEYKLQEVLSHKLGVRIVEGPVRVGETVIINESCSLCRVVPDLILLPILVSETGT